MPTRGFLLDGFPRTLSQAHVLDKLRDDLAVVHIAAPDDEIIKRLSSRRICESCALTQSVSDGGNGEDCPYCGGRLVRREDDDPETVRKRLTTYAALAGPLIHLYSARPGFIAVDGLQLPDKVTADLQRRDRRAALRSAASSKLQAPTPKALQTPNTQVNARLLNEQSECHWGSLVLGGWECLGIWRLGTWELTVLSSPALTSTSDDARRGAVISRVTRRMIPFAFICYVVAYIDRVNIGFAARELQQDLGLSATEYGLGAGLFFLGYCVFEIPSNLILDRVGARRWIARIMIGWGIVSMATMFISDVTSFMIARVVLGLAEAGFFPGMVLYLTYWIPAAERARTNALFMMAAPVSVIVGAPVSEAIMRMNGMLRIARLAVAVPARRAARGDSRIPGAAGADRPAGTGRLAAGRRPRVAVGDDERGTRAAAADGARGVLSSLRSGRVWLLTLVYLLNTSVTYGIFLWLPRMLQDTAGPGVSVSLYTAIPFMAALVGMVLIGRHSDKTAERKLHVAACAITASVGLFIAVAFHGNLYMLVLAFTISQVGQRSVMSVFWTIPPMLLGGTAAAAGIALINAIGNLGGFFGPTMMGWLRDMSGGYNGGLLVLAGALILEAVLVASLRLPAQRPASVVRSRGVRSSRVRFGVRSHRADVGIS